MLLETLRSRSKPREHPPLLALPPELHYHICSYLTLPAVLSLRLTAQHLSHLQSFITLRRINAHRYQQGVSHSWTRLFQNGTKRYCGSCGKEKDAAELLFLGEPPPDVVEICTACLRCEVPGRRCPMCYMLWDGASRAKGWEGIRGKEGHRCVDVERWLVLLQAERVKAWED